MLNTLTKREAREFIRQYLVTALWSSHDYRSEPDSDSYDPDAGECMDDSYEPDDLLPACRAEVRADVFSFIRQCNDAGIDLRAVSPDLDQHAHDLWLTRCGHGAGFWDRGYGSVGDKLSDIARMMGNLDCLDCGDHFILE